MIYYLLFLCSLMSVFSAGLVSCNCIQLAELESPRWTHSHIRGLDASYQLCALVLFQAFSHPPPTRLADFLGPPSLHRRLYQASAYVICAGVPLDEALHMIKQSQYGRELRLYLLVDKAAENL